MKEIFGKHLLYTAGLGGVFWIIGEALYNILTLNLWQPLGISVYFVTFGLILWIGCSILSAARGDRFYLKRNNPKQLGENTRFSFILLVVLFALTIGLEFLYEVGAQRVSEPMSYVFVIDDSGSMEGNDPQMERTSAIRRIMEKQDADFPYAVYKFTDVCTKLKDMAPYRETDVFDFQSDGGTDILGALDTVIQDLKIGNGEMPKILLLSDGSSSSFGKGWILSECRENSISISTITFGSSYVNSLLKSLAQKTGGIALTAEDPDTLYQQMETAILTSAKRNLISERFVSHWNALYAVLRVVFLSGMGLLWSLFKTFAYCGRKSWDMLPFSVLMCVFAALLTEILFAVSWSGGAIRLIFCILWALMPGKFEKVSSSGRSGFAEPDTKNGNTGSGFVPPNLNAPTPFRNIDSGNSTPNKANYTIDQK